MLNKDELTAKRINKLLMHVMMIARNKSGVAPEVIAERALKDDAEILKCINGRHQWIDASSHQQALFICGPCGCEVASLKDLKPLMPATSVEPDDSQFPSGSVP